MKNKTLMDQLDDLDEDAPVMVIGPDGVIHSVVEVSFEPRSDDGEGNVTSTGDTIWLKVEEY